MRLSTRELKKLLNAIYDVHSEVNLGSLLQHIPRSLLDIIPSDAAALGLVTATGGVEALHYPEAPDQKLMDAFLTHIEEHPSLTHALGDQCGNAVKISDFAALEKWKKTALYNEYFKPRSLNHQLGVCFDTGRALLGFSANRQNADFTEEERMMLELLGPHFTRAYVNAVRLNHIRSAISLSHEAMDTLGVGLMKVDLNGHIFFATKKAEALVQEFFEPSRDGVLPEMLRWYVIVCANKHAPVEDSLDLQSDPLRRTQNGRELTVTPTSGGDGKWWLSLRLWVQKPDLKKLQKLGLTEREAEVLFWIAQGKATSEISMILGARPTTVKKHSQRIFEKLGVENRATAAARAIEVLQA